MSTSKKVILPEDAHALLESEQSFLNRSGIRTFATVTNEEALKLHKKKKADLIIAYLDLPGMKGETLCSLIRDNEELRSVSIILICPDNAGNEGRCAQCGANAFITIPLSNAVLLQEAYQLLNIAPRRSCRVPIKVNIDGTSKGRPFTGLVEDISISGILFRSAAVFNEGDSVKCAFSLPGSGKINVGAEIVRVIEKESDLDTHLYGIRFVNPVNDLISAIDALLGKDCGHYTLT